MNTQAIKEAMKELEKATAAVIRFEKKANEKLAELEAARESARAALVALVNGETPVAETEAESA
jgi:phage shock protein A